MIASTTAAASQRTLPAMDPRDPNNRLYLNVDKSQQQRFAPSDRAYPTTPSTFPQLVPQNLGQQMGQSSGQNYNQQYQAQGNYFPPQSQSYSQQYQQGGPNDYLNAQNSYPRSGTPTDPNGGLAHQFSHQNLGGAARAGSQGYAPRGPSSSSRPRTSGSSHQSAGSHQQHPPMPSTGPRPAEFQAAPERTPEKYGTNANNNQKKCSQLAADFFKDSVKRARERNLRYVMMAQ